MMNLYNVNTMVKDKPSDKCMHLDDTFIQSDLYVKFTN